MVWNWPDRPSLEFNHDWRHVYQLIRKFVTYCVLKLFQEIVPDMLDHFSTDPPTLGEREVGVGEWEVF